MYLHNNHKLSHLYWLNCSLQNNSLPALINSLINALIIRLKWWLNIMFKRQLKTGLKIVFHSFLKSVLYLASSDAEFSSSRIAATLRLDLWCWTTGLQMIKEQLKKYFINLHFMERTDSLKEFTLKVLRPIELIHVNKETQTPF